MPDHSQLPAPRAPIFAAFCLFWLVPGHPEPAAFDGAIVGPSALLAIALLWLCCHGSSWRGAGGSGPALIALAGALAMAATAHFADDNRGLVARYYDNPHFAPPVEPALPVIDPAFTRIEPAIAFGARGFAFAEPYFLLAFANDTARRHWTAGADHGTAAYPFSVVFEGFVHVPADASAVRLEAGGGSAELRIDGALAPDGRAAIAAGSHAIDVRYARDGAGQPGLRLFWTIGDGERPVPAAAFTRDGRAPVAAARLGMFAALALWLGAFAALLHATRPRFALDARLGAWALVVGLMLRFASNLASDGRDFDFQIFEAGNDWLDYESLARAIRGGDIASAGEGALVFLNFGYRYLLAAMHFLAGEAPANAMLLQRAVMAAVIGGAVYATRQLYGAAPAWALAIIVIACKHFPDYAEPLLDTTFGIALGAAALFCLIRYGRHGGRGTLAAAAALLGTGILVRANFLPLLALGCAWIFLRGHGGRPRQLLDAALLCGIALALAALLGVRNHAVSGQWVFLPTNGLSNLWVGNHPPQFDGPTYFTAQLVPPAEIVPRIVAYAQAEPLALLRRIGDKALFILGIDQKHKVHAAILLPWLIAFAGSFGVIKRRDWRAELALLWGWIALINLPLLLLFPWGYGWRLSAPSFLPLYLIDALALAIWSGALRERWLARRSAAGAATGLS